uniref:CSON002125 protein n=1 Tax=Culicoides sonorensis TaxID=179676 RepID=A0A336LVD0_CULSO
MVQFNQLCTSMLLAMILHLNMINGAPAVDDGKYRPVNDGKYRADKYGKSGKYIHDDSGKYVSDVDKYRYVHIHIPYDGGYGPYFGIPNPYEHDGRPYVHDTHPIPPAIPYVHQTDKYGYAQELDKYPYNQVPDKYPYKQNPDKYPYNQNPDKYPYKQEDSKSASTNVVDPFKTDYYVIPKPKIVREYGPPTFDPTNNIDARYMPEKSKKEVKVTEKPKFVIKA